MKLPFIGVVIFSLAPTLSLIGQKHSETDTLKPAKIQHAEPLYIDLIRDLGARKGEKEWNVGLGLTDKLNFDSYEALVEYEWAPIDRLGLEVELPFTFFSPLAEGLSEGLPANRLNSLKLAGQWTFLVKPQWGSTMAIGYINELEFADFNRLTSSNLLIGNVYNPFLVVAKHWGSSFHSLIYTGPKIAQSLVQTRWDIAYEMNTSLHYLIPSSRNFIGVEFNKSWAGSDFDMTIRPQMRLGIADNLLIGIVVGIPVKRENERISSFLRLIWEPGHRHKPQ